MLFYFNIPLLLIFVLNFVFSAPSPNSTNVDVSLCLKQFYKATYNNDYNCTEELNFFENNSTALRNAFTNGKSCFLEIAEEECQIKQFNILKTDYDQVVKILTTKPFNDSNCESLYYKYDSQKCEAMISAIDVKMVQVPNKVLQMNNTKVLELIGLCDDAKTCINENCLYEEAKRKEMTEYCETIEFSNTEFSICQQKIMKQLPDLSQYECLEGFDFYQQTVASLTEKYTVMRECTQEIMEDICGEIEDFDKYSDIYVKSLKRLDAIEMVLTNQQLTF